MDMDKDSGFVGRLEVVEMGRRRRWSVEDKIRIVEESLAGHRQASATARRHGIPNPLLFKWRRDYRLGHLGGGSSSSGFVPAIVMPDDAVLAPGPSATGGRMEIVLAGGRRMIVAADVDTAALKRVLDVLEQA